MSRPRRSLQAVYCLSRNLPRDYQAKPLPANLIISLSTWALRHNFRLVGNFSWLFLSNPLFCRIFSWVCIEYFIMPWEIEDTQDIVLLFKSISIHSRNIDIAIAINIKLGQIVKLRKKACYFKISQKLKRRSYKMISFRNVPLFSATIKHYDKTNENVQ